jgi:hypothetical protein
MAMRVAEPYLAQAMARPAVKKAGTSEPATPDRVDAPELEVKQLDAYAGVYVSPELDLTYRLVVSDGTLRVNAPHRDEFPLTPTRTYEFQGFPLRLVPADFRFEPDRDHRVTGVRVSLHGVRGLRFERRD